MDKVNNRLFIGHHGNSRYDIYQLDERGLPLRRHADYGLGRSLIGRGFAFAPLGRKYLNFPSNADFDPVHQRLIVPDNSSLGHPGYRILIFDVHPDTLAKLGRGELPEAIAVLGQPDFETWEPGVGRARIGSRGTALVDSERQLFFFTDGRNNRILLWDIHPDRLSNGKDASFVIGQPDFDSNQPGTGRSRLARPGSMAYCPIHKNLFVADGGNHRVLVFDVSTEKLANGIEARAVIGQKDFDSRLPRRDLRKIKPERIALDTRNHRLFEGEQFNNRLLVFEVPPDELEGALNPDAVAVVGQPDFWTTDPAITGERLTMPRITIDSQLQIAYSPDGYPAGNRINIYDIHPDRMKPALTPMLDQIGHINPEGEPDFLARSANDRTSPRYWTQGRDIAIDTADHRLFMSDNYGHRVLVYRLDRMNRILERSAGWALGQKDTATSIILPGRDATVIKLPLAVEYDESHKRLFVADTWNDRVLVFDMTPGRVSSGMKASYVLGQPDFTTYDPGTTRNRIYFGSREGRGIYTTEARAGELAMDKSTQRLFLTDGANHRVLVFDVHPDRIRNGADAIAVIGQEDFTSAETGLSRTRWELPGDLVIDEKNQRLFVGVAWQHRVLVFDVHPDRLRNGQPASFVIGQADFESGEPGLSRRRFRQTDGLSYDWKNDRLYVTDKYNHRVLIFDVRPQAMQNLPEAIAVMGELDFQKVRMGPGDARNYPDRLHDPRGSAFDSRDQRLFQSEGLNGRLTVFTMPRTDYRLDLPPRSGLAYGSLDAHTSTGAEDYTVGYSEVELERAVKLRGVSSHLVSRVMMDPDSERQSRVVLSEAMLPVPDPAASALLYFDSRESRRLNLSLVNAGSETTEVRFRLRTDSGTHSANRWLAAGQQLSVDASLIFSDVGETTGALGVESDQPVAVAGLLEVPNGRGAHLLVPAPLARDVPANSLARTRRILPWVETGAGRRVAYVLLNATGEVVSGTLEVDGRQIEYRIAPRGAFAHEVGDDSRALAAGHGLVRAARGEAPSASALVLRERRDGTYQSAHIVNSHQEGTLFWAPVDTHPGLIRHGRVDAHLTLVNEGPVPATVYLELFDPDGNRPEKSVEQIVPLGRRDRLSLEDVFGRGPIRGTLRVFADSEVALSLEQRIANVAGEEVVTDIPLQATPGDAVSRAVFPFFANGSGTSTQMLLLNLSRRTATEGALRVRAPDGEARTLILR